MTKELYETFVKGEIHLTDATTAELVKVMENTYRDVNIAFANELAKIAETIDVDIWEAIRFANFHPRVNIHTPGPGVGGHCIAVDPWFLVELSPEKSEIIKKSRLTNDGMPKFTAQKAKTLLEENGIQNGKVAILGLAFKGDVDDLRESPSTEVIKELQNLGINVTSFDPHIKELQHPTQKATLGEAVQDIDLIILTTDHTEFKQLNPEMLNTGDTKPLVFDTKNALNRDKWEQAGFRFFKLGDGKHKGTSYYMKEEILGVQVNTENYDELIPKVFQNIEDKKKSLVVAINPEKLMKAKEDPELKALLNRAEFQIPDGIGVIIASKLQKGNITSRVTGVDMMDRVVREAARTRKSIFLYGAKPGVADKAAAKLIETYPDLIVAGTQDGYEKDNNKVIDFY